MIFCSISGIHSSFSFFDLSSFQSNVIKDWQFFFGVPEPDKIEKLEKLSYGPLNDSITLNYADFIISFCFFHDMLPLSGHSPVYFSNSQSSKLLIEETTFNYCRIRSGSGAAIYVSNGNTALHKVCGYNCSSGGNQGFATIYGANNPIFTKNNLHTSSISHCKATNYILFFEYGYAVIESSNISQLFHVIQVKCFKDWQ